MLPANAPPEYSDRNTLWNAAEKIEKQWNAQLARRIVLALPREVPADQYPAMLQDFCREHFVSKGMCVDFAIHDKGDGNPHVHIMLTMRAMGEHGEWLPKSKKVYDLDESGNRIRLPSGNWKSHKEDTVDWNEQSKAEIWRHGWEVVTNRYLEQNGRPERVDLRSFERQGIDLAPTIHLGPAVTQISDSPEGILMESILEGFAEYYSADLSEKIVRGMTENALKGKFNGGRVPIGYVVDEEQSLQIDPLTAPYVLEAFKRYAEGQDMKAIRDWLNEKGITTSKGKPMTYNIVHNMLKNRRYLGEYVFRDMLIPDGIPAIVPVELFDKVQARMELNAKAPARKKAKEEYLLSTKLFCGYCGATICGESGTGRNGESHHYYKCATAKKNRTECDLKPAKKVWLEDLVVNETVKLLQDDKIIDAVVSRVMKMQAKESEEMPFLEARLKEAEDSIDNLLKAIEMGVITKSTKERLEALETEKAELESQIALEKLKQPTLTEEFVRYWLERFRGIDTANLAHRKLLIDVFLNTVFLYNDKVVITFNYKEDAETINFSDIEAALDSCALGSDFKFPSSPKTISSPSGGLICF